MKMKQDKYSGYWKDKTCNRFYKILWKHFPRWRYVDSYVRIRNKFSKIGIAISVDYLRLHCEKITEKEFKYATRR